MTKIKIVCLSDTHGRSMTHPVPGGDILIHAGDATVRGTVEEIFEFGEWFNALPHPHKIFVAGNHDWLYQKNRKLADGFVPSLQDELVEVEGLKIYGSPWQPEFGGWAFNLPRGEALKKIWERVPTGVDILVTHTPPHRILDSNPRGWKVGCQDLSEELKRINPRLHVFGHLHGCGGKMKIVGDTTYVNAAICDEEYVAKRKPVVVEIER